MVLGQVALRLILNLLTDLLCGPGPAAGRGNATRQGQDREQPVSMWGGAAWEQYRRLALLHGFGSEGGKLLGCQRLACGLATAAHCCTAGF